MNQMVIKKHLLLANHLLEAISTVVRILAELERFVFLHVHHDFFESLLVGLLAFGHSLCRPGQDVHAASQSKL